MLVWLLNYCSPVEEYVSMKIIIEVNDNGNTTITEESEGIVYPICNITPNKFAISDVTNIMRIKLVGELIYELAHALAVQLNIQKFVDITSINLSNLQRTKEEVINQLLR